MRCFRFICALLLTLAAPSSFALAILQGPVVDPANGHSYYLLDTDSWTNSESQAVAMGGFITTIRNSAENDFVFNTFRGPTTDRRDLWIGLSDPHTGDGTGAAHAANFVWASGEAVTYTNWSASEPNNDPNNGGEYYASLTGYAHNGQTPGDWNDKNNAGTVTVAYGVVEVVPEPATLALASVPLLLLRRRRAISRRAFR